MTNEKPPRGRPRERPKGFDDVPELSPEEVERRVDVRGGAAPREPIERAARVPRPARAPRRGKKTGARDSLLLIGLVIVGLVAVRVLLPDGPLSATATDEPSGTLAAIESTTPSTPAPVRTPGLVTLPPGPSPTADLRTPEPTPSVKPTPVPTATPTHKPGQTPRPTPKPTTVPTPGATAPNRVTVVVKMVVNKDSGGSSAAAPADWTIKVSGAAGSSASPNNFPGSAAGTSVSIPAGAGFSITSNNVRTDFAAYPLDPDCASSAGLAVGSPTVTCTITRDDRPRINVTVNVNGGGPLSASDVTVTVTGGQAQPSSLSGSGLVVVGFGLTYSISAPNKTDYTSSGPVGAACDGSLAIDAPPGSCTFTYDYSPSPAPAGGLPVLILPWILPFLLPRRWRTTTAG